MTSTGAFTSPDDFGADDFRRDDALAIPIAVVPVRIAYASVAGPPLVQALKRMAIAELAFALLFALGLLL